MCEFCKLYKWAKETTEQIKITADINTHLSIRLHEEREKDGIIRSAMTYKPMKLIYCPSCGKRLVGKEIKDD